MRRAVREPGFDDLPRHAEPLLAAGDHIFVHQTERQHLVWHVLRGRPVVLIDGRFRSLARDDYLPLVCGG